MSFTYKVRTAQTYTAKARNLPASTGRYGIARFGKARYGNVNEGYNPKPRTAQTYSNKSRPA